MRRTIVLLAVLLLFICGAIFNSYYYYDRYYNALTDYNTQLERVAFLEKAEAYQARANIILRETQTSKVMQLENRINSLRWMVDSKDRAYRNQIWLLERANFWLAKNYEDKLKDIADEYDAKARTLISENNLLKDEISELNNELSKKLFDWFTGEHPISQDQLIQFLVNDDTDKTLYDDAGDDWVCVEYTTLLMANAAEEGIRIYPTIVWFIDSRTYTVIEGHTMNFAIVESTLDDGTVVEMLYLIEPQSDQWWHFGIWRDKSTWELPAKLFPMLP